MCSVPASDQTVDASIATCEDYFIEKRLLQLENFPSFSPCEIISNIMFLPTDSSWETLVQSVSFQLAKRL